jgi:catechol 2,3-dioxygenase-like lactoylglutathione lyase family enzyme
VIDAIHHTGLTVSSLDRALAFYRDALGLEVVMEQEKAGGYLAEITGYPTAHVRMAHLATPAGQRLELFEYLAPRGRQSPGEPRDVGITHVCLVVADVHDAYRRLVAAGAEPFSEPVPIDTGANAGAFGLYVRDPDGIVLELFQPAGA